MFLGKTLNTKILKKTEKRVLRDKYQWTVPWIYFSGALGVLVSSSHNNPLLGLGIGLLLGLFFMAFLCLLEEKMSKKNKKEIQFNYGKLKPAECPHCGTKHDGFTSAALEDSEISNDDNNAPYPGAIVICGECGSINQFNDNLQFEPASENWESEIRQKHGDDMVKVIKLMAQTVDQKNKNRQRDLLPEGKKYWYPK